MEAKTKSHFSKMPYTGKISITLYFDSDAIINPAQIKSAVSYFLAQSPWYSRSVNHLANTIEIGDAIRTYDASHWHLETFQYWTIVLTSTCELSVRQFDAFDRFAFRLVDNLDESGNALIQNFSGRLNVMYKVSFDHGFSIV